MKIKKFAVIGNNVDKSLSPYIFNYWFKQNNESAEYEILKLSEINEYSILNIKQKYFGCNITIPFKEKILEYADNFSNEVNLIKAANIIKIIDNKIYLYNSDKDGFKNSIKKYSDISVRNYNRIFILGYGGAAKSIEMALEELNVEKSKIKIFIRNKFDNKKFFNIEEIEGFIDNDLLIINCTPIGSCEHMNFSFNLNNLKNSAVIDIVYKPFFTKLLTNASNNTLKIVHGLYMLIEQAAITYYHWFGYYPKVENKLIEELKILCR